MGVDSLVVGCNLTIIYSKLIFTGRYAHTTVSLLSATTPLFIKLMARMKRMFYQLSNEASLKKHYGDDKQDNFNAAMMPSLYKQRKSINLF